jgi:CBS domain-containing protein
MDNLAAVLQEKGSTVHTIAPQATVLAAVEKMCAEKIGALLVWQEGWPLGIFTERDVMARSILKQHDLTHITIAEVMTKDVVCVSSEATTLEAMALMTDRRCRHLPVIDHGKVVGLVSIGDLVRWISRRQEFEIRKLTDYICNTYPG